MCGFELASYQKVADFGFSRRIAEGTVLVTFLQQRFCCKLLTHRGPGKHYGHSNTIIGPLRWLPREVFVGDAVKYSPASDVYMFAMLMYEVLAEQLPFAEVDVVFKAWSLAADGARPKCPPDCPRDLFEIAERCWAAEPEERPTAAQAAEMLELWLDMQEPPPPYQQE